jgi:hypothetical protein
MSNIIAKNKQTFKCNVTGILPICSNSEDFCSKVLLTYLCMQIMQCRFLNKQYLNIAHNLHVQW